MNRVRVSRANEAHARQLRMLAIEENRAAKAWHKLLRAFATVFGNAYAGDGQQGLDDALAAYAKQVGIALEANWSGAMASFAGATSAALSKARPCWTVEAKAKKDNQVEAATRDWATKYAGEKVVSIVGTASDKFKRIITEGTIAGWSNDKIAREIERQFRGGSAYDSMRIARTETHGAAMAGSDIGARATGLEMQKQWLSAGAFDGRTRAAHLEADGQTVPMAGAFLVGGERLSFPGDPSGSAGNVIQCRCTVLYIPKD